MENLRTKFEWTNFVTAVVQHPSNEAGHVMAGLDELFNQVPTQQIAAKLGADEGEVNSAVKTLVPVLVGGLHQNAQDPDAAGKIENAASNHAASGLLDGGVSVDQVDEADGSKAVARIFAGNDTGQVASALAGGNNPLGSILGSVLGGNQGGALGGILGGLLGGKK